MPIFCLNFNFIFISFSVTSHFYLSTNTFFLLLCCGYNCNVNTHANILLELLFHFLFHFSLLHFPFLFFYLITLFYITFVAVLTTAMPTLMPIYSTHVLHTGCSCTLDRPGHII